MFKALLAAHLVLAVFAVGPLVHAATTAARAVRSGDAAAAASSARMLRIYAYASLLVVLVGFGLMSTDAPWNPNEKVAEFKDTWIWLSLLLWVVAMAVVLGLVAPTLEKAGEKITAGGSATELIGRVAAAGGAVGLIFLVIVVLMVYQPGG